MADSQIAVLIDYENVGLSSVQRVFDQVSDIGRVIVKRAYADWSQERSQRERLLELGIEPIHLFRSPKSGKNASDLRLTIDAVDLLYQATVDTFVIVSTDSDFVPLVSRLRGAGKTVIGAGPEATVPRTLVIACDRFLYLERKVAATITATPQVTKPAPKPDSLLVRAVKASMDEEGRAAGSKLHQTLQRLDPSFDFRAQGYSTLTRYLEASSEVRVTRPKGHGDVVAELTDSDGVSVGGLAPEVWGPQVDAAWGKRANMPGDFIHGNAAAGNAAVILGARKLADTEYKTLQKLIDSSQLLRGNWRRDGNRVVRL